MFSGKVGRLSVIWGYGIRDDEMIMRFCASWLDVVVYGVV
jgi:hypothetical protein